MTEINRTNDTTIPAPSKDNPAAREVPLAQREILSRDDIAARCRSAATAAERRRWQVIALLADGVSVAEVVAATGYRPRTIREIARHYEQAGAAALADRRAHSRGAPTILSPALQRELQLVLQAAPPDGGAWTGPKVARWIAARTGRRIHRQRGWEYLRRLRRAEPPVPQAPDQIVRRGA